MAAARPAPPPAGGPRPAALRLALTLLVAVIAAGALLADRARAPSRASGPPAQAAAAVPGPPASRLSPGVVGVPDRAAVTGPRAAVPVRLRIPALHIDTGLDALTRRPDGTLSTPPRWSVPGWYRGGPRPGEQGPAVIAGHVDSTAGPAVFFGLRWLHRGDPVDVVERGGRVLHFAVGDIRRVPKNRFPTALVYGPQPVPVLRLITCTGRFDLAARSYQDNLVVSAYLHSGLPLR